MPARSVYLPSFIPQRWYPSKPPPTLIVLVATSTSILAPLPLRFPLLIRQIGVHKNCDRCASFHSFCSSFSTHNPYEVLLARLRFPPQLPTLHAIFAVYIHMELSLAPKERLNSAQTRHVLL
ncbi:hypothetical protein Pst134EA_004814 [Puccinia striiformis f. sp. tritici]|uniref:hypothetical protein n=1 Tax=Puccinia striiformis f. sp. tritici TaxID=168172 RepID=UPI00200877C0|nr:hypothetical protein Pst134EA_004814 [Puccinia striiformis f. sp. tritici]KAH9461996.1 hypothetical protein Pst134EB_033306 [Puccinia striiformis f. sp. tritici]KAH9470902.1 hypothetical protein Pst134EA_004814 [Puccinia striiformis f. sp. tritici]